MINSSLPLVSRTTDEAPQPLPPTLNRGRSHHGALQESVTCFDRLPLARVTSQGPLEPEGDVSVEPCQGGAVRLPHRHVAVHASRGFQQHLGSGRPAVVGPKEPEA